MKTLKCFCISFLVILIEVSVLKAIPSINTPLDIFSPQLLKDYSKQRSAKKGSFYEPPQYMLDLYNEVADSKGVTKSPLPHGASLVRAVPVQVFSDRQFTFSLESIPAEETILEAEVHIHHHQLNSEQRQQLRNHNLFDFNLFIEDDDGGQILAQSHTLGGHFSGWRVFSVGEVVKEARRKGKSITFMVETKTMEGLVIDTKFHHGYHSSTNPILVLFNKVADRDRNPFTFQELSLRNEQNLFPQTRRTKRSIGQPAETPTDTQSGCELHSLIVDFEKIGWSWMVYPKVYDAHQCVGRCSFPLGQDYNPTNHATVLSIVHFLSGNSQEVTYPSCVPITYKGLAILYYDVEDTVILKQFDSMGATKCGCR